MVTEHPRYNYVDSEIIAQAGHFEAKSEHFDLL